MEARCHQVEEQAEQKEQELRSQVTSLEEATVQSENQVKELKETIFELEDQVEQHRAVNCHTNQAVLDMESMSASDFTFTFTFICNLHAVFRCIHVKILCTGAPIQ